jgi:hypothetical protein
MASSTLANQHSSIASKGKFSGGPSTVALSAQRCAPSAPATSRQS